MAIMSMVFSVVFWPLGIVFGHIALTQLSRDGGDGRGWAITGLIISYTSLAVLALYLIIR